jgi:hypothetical protein
MALHIAGVTIGDVNEDHCSLAHAADVLRVLVGSIGSVWDRSFEDHSDAEIFALLDRELYVDYGQSEKDIETAQRRYGRFDFLTNTGEQFDNFKTFLYAHPSGSVHILYQKPNGSIGAAECRIDSFVAASKAFLQWFDAQRSTPVGVA